MTLASIPSRVASPPPYTIITSVVFIAREAIDKTTQQLAQVQADSSPPSPRTEPPPDQQIARILDRYVQGAMPGEDRATARQRIEIAMKEGRHAKLDLSGLGLRELPQVLPEVSTLNLSGNQLSSLPPLPCAVTVLLLARNRLQKLPDVLPSRLATLDVSENCLSELPESLPDSIEYLYACDNELERLPKRLPRSLLELHVARNRVDLTGEAASRVASTMQRRVFNVVGGGPAAMTEKIMKTAQARRCDLASNTYAIRVESQRTVRPQEKSRL